MHLPIKNLSSVLHDLYFNDLKEMKKKYNNDNKILFSTYKYYIYIIF